jgi:hypothetical protein
MHKVDLRCLDVELTLTPFPSVYYGFTEEDKEIVYLVTGELPFIWVKPALSLLKGC